MPEITASALRPEPGESIVDERSLRAELVAALRSLTDRGLLTQTSGNVSVRLGNHHLLITPSSMSYDHMGIDDLAVVDLGGKVVVAPHRPSSELPLHLAVYAGRPDLRALVHTHSPMATTFAVLHQPIPAVHYMLTTLAQARIEVCPYAVFGSRQLAENVRHTFVAPARALLLANHGLVTGAGTLAQACVAAETVELLAGLYYRALSIGVPHVLTDEQLDTVSEQIKTLTYAEPA